MKSPTCLLVPLFVTTIAISSAEVSVEPAGIQIVWKSLKNELGGYRTFNSTEGVSVAMAATVKEKKFISFVKDTSTVTLKDVETDLGGKFSFWDRISEDGKTMKLEMSAAKLPSKEAAAVQVVGSLDLVIASKTKTESIGPREFKEGDELGFGDDFKFSIDKIGKPKWGDEVFGVVFKWKRKKVGKVPELKEVRFYSEDGKLIESKRAGSSWTSMAGNHVTTISYTLKKKTETLKIEMDIWEDAETVTVPFDMALSIGGRSKTE